MGIVVANRPAAVPCRKRRRGMDVACRSDGLRLFGSVICTPPVLFAVGEAGASEDGLPLCIQ